MDIAELITSHDASDRYPAERTRRYVAVFSGGPWDGKVVGLGTGNWDALFKVEDVEYAAQEQELWPDVSLLRYSPMANAA